MFISECSDASLPSIKFPPTSTTLGNKTYNFQEMVVELGTGYIVIPVISILANVAIAKAFGKQYCILIYKFYYR